MLWICFTQGMASKIMCTIFPTIFLPVRQILVCQFVFWLKLQCSSWNLVDYYDLVLTLVHNLLILFCSFYLFYCLACIDSENLLDPQVPFIPLVELLVKALLVIGSSVLAASKCFSVELLCCSHHPFLNCTSKKNIVWKVIVQPLLLKLINV